MAAYTVVVARGSDFKNWQEKRLDLAIVNNGESKILLDESAYAFEDFLLDYGRVYDDAAEHAKREAIFYENLNTIVEHNNNRLKTAKNDRGGHALGVNVLADRRAKELHMGYDKYQRSRLQYQTGGHTASVSRRLVAEDDIEKRLSIQIENVNDLPQHVDWRTKGVATPVKSLGAADGPEIYRAAKGEDRNCARLHVCLSTGVGTLRPVF